jgi:hypothetical protein
MGHFAGIKNLDDLKSIYRKLCKQHHPDLGGDVLIMQQINAEYSAIIKAGFIIPETSNFDIEESIRDIIERTTVFEGLIVELCGRWVWFTGETYRWKSQLKAIGCFFASKKKAWYWRPADEQRRGPHKPMEFEQIKEKYGSVIFDNRKACNLP